MPATGKQVRTVGMTMIRFRDGKFGEAWQTWYMLGLLQQINGAERHAKMHLA